MLELYDRFRHCESGEIYRIVQIFQWGVSGEEAVVYENEHTGEQIGCTSSLFLQTLALKPKFEKLATIPKNDPLYVIKEDYDDAGLPYWIISNCAGEGVATLKGGTSAIIILSYMNMQRQSQQRANDYMSGVIQGCTHYQLAQSSV
jgi:hypothetical protein